MSTPTEKELSDKFGYWNEHPDYPLDQWEYAIRHRRTRQGYWAWAADRLEIDTSMAEDVATEDTACQ